MKEKNEEVYVLTMKGIVTAGMMESGIDYDRALIAAGVLMESAPMKKLEDHWLDGKEIIGMLIRERRGYKRHGLVPDEMTVDELAETWLGRAELDIIDRECPRRNK